MTEPQTTPRFQWERFTQKLLATTCLGVAASGAAHAGTIIEGTDPAPSDFSNTGPGYLLPVGTTIVQGVLHSGNGDNDDFFEFQGLDAGHNYSLFATYNPLGQERQVSYTVFNSSHTQLGSTTLEGEGGLISGTIPGDGLLDVDVHFASEGNPSYQVALSAEMSPAPEPAVGWAAGIAMTAALAWKRKKATA